MDKGIVPISALIWHSSSLPLRLVGNPSGGRWLGRSLTRTNPLLFWLNLNLFFTSKSGMMFWSDTVSHLYLAIEFAFSRLYLCCVIGYTSSHTMMGPLSSLVYL